MNETRTYKSIRNAKWGIILQIATILTRFVTTTVFVRVLGIGYNGLNGLLNEVIAMLSLAEMGIGTAIIYNLYKPLAEHDIDAVQRLMGLFRKAYHIIAAVMLLIGVAATPFIHLIVKGVAFDVNYIRIVFFLFVLQTSSSYLFAYKRSLLNADQSNYVVSIVTLVVNIFLMAAGICILIFTNNYIIYLLMQIFVSIAANIAISVIADKRYPYIRNNKAKALRQEKTNVLTNVKHIFIGTLSGKITSSTDNILISVLVSTYQIGIYANYAQIMNASMALFQRAAESISGGIGNLMVTEKGPKVDLVFRRVSFLFSAIGFGVALVLYGVLTPFVKLWIGEHYTIGNAVLYISLFNAFLFIAREPLWKMVLASGLFKIDKRISIIGSLVNLVISIVLGNLWGMAGIFLGTTLSLLIQIVLKVLLLYRYKLEVSSRSCFVKWLYMGALTAIGMVAIGFVCEYVHTSILIVDIIAKAFISAAVVFAVIIILFRNTDEFSFCVGLIKRIIRKEVHAGVREETQR